MRRAPIVFALSLPLCAQGPVLREAHVVLPRDQNFGIHLASGDVDGDTFVDHVFENNVAGIPQLAPAFGAATSNMIYDGPGEDADFGAMQISGDPADKYKFRTSALRNISLSPAFFHNGAFAKLEDAIRFHVNPTQS